jgi:hypothetical protein
VACELCDALDGWSSSCVLYSRPCTNLRGMTSTFWINEVIGRLHVRRGWSLLMRLMVENFIHFGYFLVLYVTSDLIILKYISYAIYKVLVLERLETLKL